MVTTLTFLGTASGRPTARRAHSSMLLDTGTERLLLDAGEPCARQLTELAVPLDAFPAVLITHGHADHTGGLPLLLQGCAIFPRTAPLTIYLPGELIAPLRGWLEAIYLQAPRLGFSLSFVAWESAPVHQIGGAEVRTWPTSHLDSTRRQLAPGATDRFRAYALDLRLSGRRIVYSGDVGNLEDLEDPLREPTDVLICEATHITEANLIEFLRKQRVPRVFLTHFGPELEPEREEFTARVASALDGVSEVVGAEEHLRAEF